MFNPDEIEFERMVQETCVLVKRTSTAASLGTAFFVSPRHILTCFHVLQSTPCEDLQVLTCDGEKCSIVSVEQPLPTLDLALLEIKPVTPPQFLTLNQDFNVGEPCYSWGFSQANPAGDPAYLTIAGTTGANAHLEQDPYKRGLLKLDFGQVSPEHSGSPLVSLRTRQACGIISPLAPKS